ncbi:inovirus Gp2 family protein [Scandinavium sp. TWS1a]|uniref:inovirus Gp2 family protein n=1 Tax=Scandinavium tedordense TaxID=2926521 RepID=UPI0021661192|nr:inovirus Gp2 family protein [Scandinavium tedordense]MCS2169575.1 inovirus Gp2 family protein [Scandinavium tedordense]
MSDTSPYGPENTHYLNKLVTVTHNALQEHPRTLAVRIDLHFSPDWFIEDSVSCYPNVGNKLMSKFIASLKSQIAAYCERQRKLTRRVHPNNTRYIWVKEVNTRSYPHFHLVLFFNKDLFRGLGDFNQTGDNLHSMIRKAWLSALGLRGDTHYSSLAHFPERCTYVLDRNSSKHREQYEDFITRTRYLAKEETKVYNPAKRSIGSSQR